MSHNDVFSMKAPFFASSVVGWEPPTDRQFGEKMSNDSSCLDMNDELWYFRRDYTTLTVTWVAFAFFYVLIIICGVIGNSLVLIGIARTRSLQTVPNLFIFSLSCSDLVVCCISATITPITAFKKEWLFGAALCSIAPFIAGISLCFSTFTLTAIAIDRYMLIRFPMKKPLTRNQALMIIGSICVLAAGISSPTVLKQRLDSFGSFCGQYCTEDWGDDQNGRRLYGAVLLGVQFLVPLTIITICYTAISLRLGQSLILKSVNNNNSTNSNGEYEWQSMMTDQQRAALKRRQRTNRMLIGMVVAFSASVLYNVARDYDMLPEYVKSQEYLFGIGTHCIAMTSTVWNPLLYAVLNLQLRAAFLRSLPECIRHCFESPDPEKTSPLMNGNHALHSVHNLNNTRLTTSGAKYGTLQVTMGAKCVQRRDHGPDNGEILRKASSKKRKSSKMKAIVTKLSVSGSTSAGDKKFLLESSPSSPDRLGPPLFRHIMSHSEDRLNGSLSSVSSSSVPTTLPRNSSF